MSKFPQAIALLAALLFGAATPASKALLQTLPTFQLAGLLYLGAALHKAKTHAHPHWPDPCHRHKHKKD